MILPRQWIHVDRLATAIDMSKYIDGIDIDTHINGVTATTDRTVAPSEKLAEKDLLPKTMRTSSAVRSSPSLEPSRLRQNNSPVPPPWSLQEEPGSPPLPVAVRCRAR